MRVKRLSFVWGMVVLVVLSVRLHAANELPEASLATEAQQLVKQFAGTMKPQLQQSLQAGGPASAIEVCSTLAPVMAQQLSEETGWLIKRVSLKPRNGQKGVADAWEQRVLEQFDQRQAAGESAKTMSYAEVVDGRYRFMKAQGVEPLCLNCHGQTLAPAVTEALHQHYPDDRATGYVLGQIRGAISLTRDF